MIRQKSGKYDQDKDSPLIGGHGTKSLSFVVIFDGRDIPQAEGDGGGSRCIRTADLIGLLEQAAEEFPKAVRTKVANKPDLYYHNGEVDEWKRKWLMVPPV